MAGVAVGVGRGWRPRDIIRGGLILLNTVFTNLGAAVITNRIIQAGTAPDFIGWGTSSTPAAVTDTALGAEAAPTTSGGRTTGSQSRVTTSVTNDTYQVQGIVTAVSSLTITEAGTFDAASAGNLTIHSVFGGISVVNGDAIQFTIGLKLIPG